MRSWTGTQLLRSWWLWSWRCLQLYTPCGGGGVSYGPQHTPRATSFFNFHTNNRGNHCNYHRLHTINTHNKWNKIQKMVWGYRRKLVGSLIRLIVCYHEFEEFDFFEIMNLKNSISLKS
jgi:hypothetical protein